MNALGPFLRAVIITVVAFNSISRAQTGGVAYEVIKSMQATELVGGWPVAPLLEGSDGALFGSTRLTANTNGGTLFKINKDGNGYRALHVFGIVPQDGSRPFASLVRGDNGLLYGTAELGGTANVGILFHIGEDGRNYRILRHFVPASGARPRGALLVGDDGAFYSTTASGGTSNGGVIYKIDQDGSDYRVLHDFRTNALDGYDPEAGMIRGSDGVLYGVTRVGGANGDGTVFRINQDGSGYSVLRHFDSDSPDGGALKATVFEASDGFLYGTTEVGSGNDGTLFRLSKDGTLFEVLHRFNAALGDGDLPWGDLIEGSDGAIYGTTYGATITGGSVIFKYHLSTAVFEVLYDFPGEPIPVSVHCGVRRGSDGFLYGVSERSGGFGSGMLFRIDERGTNFTKLLVFGGPNFGGRTPRSSVVAASDGGIYGASESGGRSNAGTIFGIDADGSNSRILKHFGDPADGRTPNGPVEATDGFLYGTAQAGGTGGQGILYKIARSGGDYTVLWNFAVGVLSTDGKSPRGTPVEAADEFLYGTTFFGGTSNRGSIFRIGRDGSNYVVIHNFLLNTNGSGPRDLIEGTDGMLYGITSTGGILNRGTAYRCSRDGSVFEVLHRFEGATDGHAPEGGLFEASDGYLYGTTTGNTTNRGTIFRMQKNGSDYSVIWRFTAGPTDGRNPKGRLIEDAEGNLIGTAWRGGRGNGTIFKIGKDGVYYEQVWDFGDINPDAWSPVAGVIRAASGIYYGTSEAGGSTGAGAVFRFDPRRVGLGITRQGSAAVIEWPASSTLDQLQESLSISPAMWSHAPEPVFDIGRRFRVTVTNATEAQRYFRVWRSWP